MAKKAKEVYITKPDSDDLIKWNEVDGDEVAKKIVDEKEEIIKQVINDYDFNYCYFPPEYNVAFLLEEEDKEDSRKDKWKVIFYEKSLSTKNDDGGTITLDNIDDLDDSENKFKILKVVENNYEEVINTVIGIIKKYPKKQEQNA